MSQRLIGVAVVSILVGFSALAFVVTNREPNTSGLTSEQLELFTTLRQDSVAAQKHLHLTERVDETKKRVDALYKKLNTLADSITKTPGNSTVGQPASLNDPKAAKLATDAQDKIAELESKLAAVSQGTANPPSETWLQIAQRVGPPTTDKVTDHAYNRMYDRFLSPIRHKDLKMLEIGLGCNMSYGPGASAKIWDAFLSPNSEIWEAEVHAECVAQNKEKLGRIKAVTGDQGDNAVLDRWLAETGGNFDFIIDDGGHRNDQILTSFAKLWPALKPGGYYFIEGMQVGRHAGHQRASGGSPVVADVLQQWSDQLLAEPGMHTHVTPLPPRQHKIPAKVDFVYCQDEACVIGKCPADDTKLHCGNATDAFATEKPIVVDAFMMNDEVDMMRYRLELHAKFVSAVFIAETNVTFQGGTKPRHALESLSVQGGGERKHTF